MTTPLRPLVRLSVPRPRTIRPQNLAQIMMQPSVGAVREETPDYIQQMLQGKQSDITNLRNSLNVDVAGLLKNINAQNANWRPNIPNLPPIGGSVRAPTGGVSLKGGVDQWIASAYKILGVPLTPSALAHERYLIQHESGGNPKAVNRWDINYKRGTPSIGLEQTIMPTFLRWKLPGYNDIYNPIHNILASLRYRRNRYGKYDIGFYKGGY